VDSNRGGAATTWDIDAGSLPLPLVIAHRGDVTTAPENTLPAFENALTAGADGVELDVRLTQDRQLVVFHDRRLDRTSNGTGRVDGATFSKVRSLDVGSWFGPAFTGERAPTLDEVFESLPRDFLINVEMKVIIVGMKLIAQTNINNNTNTQVANAQTNINNNTNTQVGNAQTNINSNTNTHDANIDGLLDTVQNTLDTTTEMKRVHLQVIEIQEKDRFLLGSDEAGVPVDVTLTGLRVSDGKKNSSPLAFQDQFGVATFASVGSGFGLLDVEIDLPKNAKDAQIFQFRVRHDHTDGTQHFGVIVVHRVGHNNLGAGQ